MKITFLITFILCISCSGNENRNTIGFRNIPDNLIHKRPCGLDFSRYFLDSLKLDNITLDSLASLPQKQLPKIDSVSLKSTSPISFISSCKQAQIAANYYQDQYSHRLLEIDWNSAQKIQFYLIDKKNWWVALPYGETSYGFTSKRWFLASPKSSKIIFLVHGSNKFVHQIIILSSTNLEPMGRIIFSIDGAVFLTKAILAKKRILYEDVKYLTPKTLDQSPYNVNNLSHLMVFFFNLTGLNTLGKMEPYYCPGELEFPWHYNCSYPYFE